MNDKFKAIILTLSAILTLNGVACKYYGKRLGPFQNTLHKVEGTVYVANADTFIITGFTYDGKGPDAHFWAGDDDTPSPRGFIVPDEYNKEDVLGEYDDAVIAIKLPEGKTMKDVKWLSVWCRKFAANFGQVFIPRDLVPPEPKVIKGFPTFGHGVRSSPVTIRDEKTIFIPDLYYDGAAPDAFFLVGNGSSVRHENAIKVPFEGEGDGHRIKQGFRGDTVTLTLPGEVTVFNVDWLSMYCIRYTENFGHLMFDHFNLNVPPVIPTPNTASRGGSQGTQLPRYKGKVIGSFGSTQHGVKGTVYAVNQNSFFIENFNYDGGAPDTFFWAGSSFNPSSDGLIVPDELGTTNVLRAYENRNILITLPRGKTIRDIKWLAVWCRQYSENFGFVTIPNNFQAPREQEIGQIPNYAHDVGSGPVVIKDSKTIQIKKFFYDGTAPDAYFLVGMGDKPSANGVKVPDETGSLNKLKRYGGNDLTIRLPADLTVFDIDWLSVYCLKFTENFGHVQIPKNLNIPADAQALQASNLQFENCEELFPDKMQVWWSVVGSDIYFQLQGRVGHDEYMAFGLSGDSNVARMVGADVAVAFYDSKSGTAKADDYKLTAKSQCSEVNGACPDTKLGGNNDVQLISYQEKDGLLKITYKRALSTGDREDEAYRPLEEQSVVAAIGGINSNGETAYHQKHYNKNTIKIKFGRNPQVNCRAFFENTNADGGDGGAGNPDTSDKWPELPFQIKNADTFYVKIGPNGGRKGYQAITGIVPWGISYWINGMLIPEITVQRGRNYTFIVESGKNIDIKAQYHPLYITNNHEGGVGQSLEKIESANHKIYGGLHKDEHGNFHPLGAGRYCEYKHKTTDQSEKSTTFEEFNKTLMLDCEDGEPAEFVWTPDSNTPNLVYYQCFTHRNLGWKIHVVNTLPSGAISLQSLGLFTVFILSITSKLFQT